MGTMSFHRIFIMGVLFPVFNLALALGNGTGEGQPRAAFHLGNGDGIFYYAAWAA